MTTLTGRQLSLMATGLELRDQGIASLERHPRLERARRAAVRLCELQGWVTSDDVQRWMSDDPPPHFNCWGALFHNTRFVAMDWTVVTTRPQGHYRRVVVWQLAGSE